MIAVIQRVLKCSVRVNDSEEDRIESGLLILLGIGESDTRADADYLAAKAVNLRIFSDDDGHMNINVLDSGGDIMVVSQFTLYADTRKGNRPSFIRAARPDIAMPLYEYFMEQVSALHGKQCASGIFGADMKLNFTNDGPVTIIIDSKNK